MGSDRYEIISQLASGGMAEVWLAKLKSIDGFEKEVVLKMIHPALAIDPDLVRMFIREARLAARLNHPNIVQILDLGKLEERYYIAMEHVPGLTLRQITNKCKLSNLSLPSWFIIQVFISVCEGLQYAHDYQDENGQAMNLVHRDLTPENIMITFNGTTKILDFGIAKVNSSTLVTRAGHLKGKFAYMSPEQVCGLELDRKSDIYTLGVVLYETLTGVRPYCASDYVDLLRQVAKGDFRPPRSHAPWMPRRLERVIQKAMAKERHKRYAEANQLSADLSDFLTKECGFHSQKELGLFICSLCPEEPNIPTNLRRLLSNKNRSFQNHVSFNRGQQALKPARKRSWLSRIFGLARKSHHLDNQTQTPKGLSNANKVESLNQNTDGSFYVDLDVQDFLDSKLAHQNYFHSISIPIDIETPVQQQLPGHEVHRRSLEDPKNKLGIPFSCEQQHTKKYIRANDDGADAMFTRVPTEETHRSTLQELFNQPKTHSTKAKQSQSSQCSMVCETSGYEGLVLNERGLEAMRNCDYRLALECFEKAIELDPNNEIYQANRKKLQQLDTE